MDWLGPSRGCCAVIARWVWLACLVLAACGGRSPEDQSFREPEARPAELGTVPAAPFDRLILRAVGGMPDANGNHADEEFVVDAALGYMQWRDRGGRGHRFLTGEEFSAILTAYSAITVGANRLCGVDAPLVTLEVQAQGRSILYVDEFYSCRPREDGGVYVFNMDGLYVLLLELTS